MPITFLTLTISSPETVVKKNSRRLESRLVNGVARPTKGRERRKENENENDISLC